MVENLEKKKIEESNGKIEEKNVEKVEEKVVNELPKKNIFRFTDFQLKGSLKESEDKFTFQGTVPTEITKDDLIIEIKDKDYQSILVISGEKKDEKGTKSFKRQFLLNEPVNIETIKAKLNENHELSLEIPKIKQNG